MSPEARIQFVNSERFKAPVVEPACLEYDPIASDEGTVGDPPLGEEAACAGSGPCGSLL